MKSGLKLIQIERNQQIRKHGFTLRKDSEYTKGELIKAAKFCLQVMGTKYWPNKSAWPVHWHWWYAYRIINKTDVEKLIVAGAFYWAEYDRLVGYTNRFTLTELESIKYSIKKQRVCKAITRIGKRIDKLNGRKWNVLEGTFFYCTRARGSGIKF